MNQIKVFTCNYCHNTQEWSYLAAINEYDADKSLFQKEVWEKELVRLKQQQLLTDNPKTQQNIISQINSVLQQLKSLDLLIKTNKEYTCKACYNKFKVQDIKTFTCDTCQEEKKGKMLEGHVGNYQIQGISPRKWSKFCQNCRDTKIIMANIYCPRVGTGRDDDWDISKPQFDCECPINT